MPAECFNNMQIFYVTIRYWNTHAHHHNSRGKCIEQTAWQQKINFNIIYMHALMLFFIFSRDYSMYSGWNKNKPTSQLDCFGQNNLSPFHSFSKYFCHKICCFKFQTIFIDFNNMELWAGPSTTDYNIKNFIFLASPCPNPKSQIQFSPV